MNSTTRAKSAILERIGDCDWHVSQAAAEGRRETTVYDNWYYLWSTGQYRKATAWWFAMCEPATQEEDR